MNVIESTLVKLLSLHQKDFCVYQRNICGFSGKQYKLQRPGKDVDGIKTQKMTN